LGKDSHPGDLVNANACKARDIYNSQPLISS